MSESEVLALAERFFAAIPRGDVATVREIYAPDAVIWHNHLDREQKPEENLRVLAWVARNVAGMRYEDVRRQATATGFVQQHVLRGTGPGGEPLEVRACIVCEVAGGRIVRLDEYLDSAALTALFG
jgi:ketosteroid isomerase-like protein